MEIEGSDGSKIILNPNSTTVFGRGNGVSSKDLSVSRRQISFDFNPSSDTQTSPTVSFEVLGKNPVWVFRKQKENGKVIAFKRFQRGEIDIDDLFCVSPKNPIWFTLKKKPEEVDEERERQSEDFEGRSNAELSQSLETSSGFKGNEDFGLDFVDVSNIDPVQEFGFLVIGHEFDQYPKQMIRDIKNWNWFLEDRKGDTDDDEEESKKKGMGGRRKRKKTRRGDDDDEDEEWTAESEGEEPTTIARKVQRPKYHTRSKHQSVSKKDGTNKKSSAKTSRREEEEEDSDDEEDETLGGFIVDDDTAEEDEANEIHEDEEVEFVEDEDEDEE